MILNDILQAAGVEMTSLIDGLKEALTKSLILSDEIETRNENWRRLRDLCARISAYIQIEQNEVSIIFISNPGEERAVENTDGVPLISSREDLSEAIAELVEISEKGLMLPEALPDEGPSEADNFFKDVLEYEKNGPPKDKDATDDMLEIPLSPFPAHLKEIVKDDGYYTFKKKIVVGGKIFYHAAGNAEYAEVISVNAPEGAGGNIMVEVRWSDGRTHYINLNDIRVVQGP